MKKYYLLIVLLIIALSSFAQGVFVPPIGSNNGTLHVKGGLIADSAFSFPKRTLSGTPYKNKGLDTNGQVAFNSVDTLPYYMKNGVWGKFMTVFDSNKAGGYVTLHYADSIGGIIADSGINIYNSNGTLFGDRTIDADGFFFKVENASQVNFLSTNGVDIGTGLAGFNVSTSGGINLNGAKVIRYGQQVTPSVGVIAYGTTVNLSAVPNQHDIEFAGGSGSSTVFLPTTNALATTGTEYIVGDAGADCIANPITIDAGTGRTINGSTIAQTYVLKFPGQVVRLKKVNNTTWKIDADSVRVDPDISIGDTVIGSYPTGLMVADHNMHVSTPDGLTYVDSEHHFEIRNFFRVDSATHGFLFGDITGVFGVGSPLIAAGLTSWNISAGNLSLQGSITNTTSTFSYGTSWTISASDPVYHILFTTGTGATILNLPTGIGVSVGRTYVLHDIDQISSTSPITIDAGVGNLIVGGTSARTYVMGINGESVTLVKVSATKWKIY